MKIRFAVLSLSLFVCASAAAQTVVETESSLVINKGTIDVRLFIESKTRNTVRVALSLLDTEGVQRASASQQIAIVPGRRAYKVSMPVGDLMDKAGDEIAWWRLSYKVADSQGIASLSELLREDFDLRASAFQRVIPGEPMRVRVRSLNPFNEKAVRGVWINAELKLILDTEADEDELILKAAAQTDGNGFATVDFKVPADIKLEYEPELMIVGRKNGIVRKIEEDLDDEDLEGTAILTSDKPLYQPGQTFNVRALLLDPNNTVVPNYELEFTIEDEDDTVVFRQKVTTSAFGIAAIAWPIPENADLGTYRVMVEAEEDLREDQLQFKVSRYDLPNFSVSTKPDKSYYLPDTKEARIEITADYLFGKPVTSGKVRVVREDDRKWNYREQKYDVIEGAVSEGITDSTGKFVARFDLISDFLDLKSHEWRRYEDLSFAAYYTDLTTNRTEQRRFDIRLAKEPIHIYLIRQADQHPDLPLTAYLSTFYADGTPAQCTVEIRDSDEVVARLKTNSLGAGKFVIDVPSERVDGSSYELKFLARDKKDQVGTFEESFYLDDDEDALQINADKTIYKPGEPIELELISTQRTGFLYVDMVKDWIPVESRVVELRGGKALMSIPYRPAFKGELMIAAYSDKDEGRWSNSMRAVRGIVYPQPQNLLINAKFSKDEYRPAEEAVVRFSVLDGTRRPVESAIGLGIFDKAIEERARTDAEFGEGYLGRFFGLMGYHRSFGNITIKDINDLDTTRPISPELQLAAEVMLAGGWYMPSVYHSGNHGTQARSMYEVFTTKQIKPVADALGARFSRDGEHPTDLNSFTGILRGEGVDFDSMRDPWGQPYAVAFSIQRSQNTVTISTIGPDKKPDTADDFKVWTGSYDYFARIGALIDKAARDYKERTGGYIRDLNTLRTELKRVGVDESRQKDPWGRDYDFAFEVSGRHYVIAAGSVGPNGTHDGYSYRSDDFRLWRTLTDYFGETEKEINRILSEEVNVAGKPFPRSEAEFAEMLKRGGLDLRSVNDGYERPVYVTGAVESRYTDKTVVNNGKQTITPVTEELMIFKIRTTGADMGTALDDADLAIFSGAVTAAHKGTGFAKAEVKTVVYSGAKGAISGKITDPNGAVVPNVEVIATSEHDPSVSFTTRSNDEGKFLLGNLPSGAYTLSIPAATGFAAYRQENLQVRSHSMLEVNVSLSVAGATEVVTVNAAADVSESVNYSVAKVKTVTGSKFNVNLPAQELSTPRVREYFPETLVWKPELLTDKRGRAELTFKMADNITTWKMFAIASNKKGKVGVVEKEITAFQSFFVDLDPPKFLTEGDEIYLPTQVRNYTEKKQRVDVTMDKADWFTFLGAGGKQRIDVTSGSSENAVFGFKAMTPIKAAKQRVTAVGESESDAIEKPVTVRPDGEEIVQTESRVFDNSTKIEINFPANALANTPRADLKIYPNLFSHVAESVEGMLARPYGCGEQTISSTYPNVMILKFVTNDAELRAKAQRYLQKGYERLTGYQVADGGFTYWGGRDSSDVALTAYALRFLNDAKEFVDVDPQVIARAEKWLITQQRPDGSWTKTYRWESSDNSMRTKLITTYAARALTMSRTASAGSSSDPAKAASTSRQTGAGISSQADALARALAYLKSRNSEIDEPYALALFGLASLDSGDIETARQIATQLEKMAIPEGSGVYWKLETNTPFYGWGTAGRVETTALVLQLLTRVAKHDRSPLGENVSKGLAFLFKNKDRYGVWYSTQTTVNVLDAFLALLSGGTGSQPQTIRVSVNGVELPDISIPADRIAPLEIDLQGRLSAGQNIVELRTTTNSTVMAQAVATHYIDWRDSRSTNMDIGTSRAIKLDYKCDRASAAIMDEISCSVQAERIGSSGYGMLLAEIGTPPGADVSRESLEKALEDDWSLSKYEVLPDRIVLYMWSKAGGSKFNFKFRPRYGINAQTPASIIYDYYNPEAHATVAPLRFNVK